MSIQRERGQFAADVTGSLALHVAMRAEAIFNIALRERANDWLVSMIKQGGIQRA